MNQRPAVRMIVVYWLCGRETDKVTLFATAELNYCLSSRVGFASAFFSRPHFLKVVLMLEDGLILSHCKT